MPSPKIGRRSGLVTPTTRARDAHRHAVSGTDDFATEVPRQRFLGPGRLTRQPRITCSDEYSGPESARNFQERPEVLEDSFGIHRWREKRHGLSILRRSAGRRDIVENYIKRECS